MAEKKVDIGRHLGRGISPQMATDHYAVLGLANGATREEIKRAHTQMALRCFPFCGSPLATTSGLKPCTMAPWHRQEGGGPLAGGRVMSEVECVAMAFPSEGSRKGRSDGRCPARQASP